MERIPVAIMNSKGYKPLDDGLGNAMIPRIGALTQEICERLLTFESAVALVSSIPGISAITAQVIIGSNWG